MKTGQKTFFYRLQPNILGLILALPVFLVLTLTAHAFQFGEGDFEGSLDSTVSYGQSWRVAKQDKDIIGIANGGRARSVNGDDGNLNYNRSLVSNVAKMTSELDLRYLNFGCFVRGTGFYDFENERSRRERTQLTSKARDLVGRSVDLLDAYVWANLDIGSMPFNIRVGEQVVSWGESTYIQNSINVINPYNVSALRLPGSELKEALVPEGMVWFSLGVTDNISFEGLYLYDWEETIIDPPGSYWSSNDFIGEGGQKVMIGWGLLPDQGNGPALTTVGAIPRASTEQANDQGQWGLACRMFTPMLNDTEFGLFFLRYHSRLPISSGITGDVAAAYPVPYFWTARYFTEYPEYINLYGLSFSTLLGKTGIAFQGEISYRQDMPLQVDDVELLYATTGAVSGAAALFNQVGNFLGQSFTYIPGYILKDVSQIQATATKFFGPNFGTDQIVVLGEIGLTYIHDMPGKSKLRLDGPGTLVSGNPILGPATHGGSNERSRYFADQTSCGYVLVSRFEYNNVFQSVNLSPRVVWQHDFYGNTPRPAGTFLEGRKAISIGIAATYQSTWVLDLSYANYFGADRHNLINDRDIIAFNLKYSF